MAEDVGPKGYDMNVISADIVTEVYREFCTKVRKDESDKYMRTIPGVSHSR